MRKYLLLLIIVSAIFSRVQSQDITARMILCDSLKSCSELQYAAMQLIPLYYQNRDFDTASRLLDYWEKHCGSDETIYRSRVLWAIDAGTFGDTLITDETIGYLDIYQILSSDSTGETALTYYYDYTPEYPLLLWYKSFTDSIVARAIHYSDLTAAERFFLQFYQRPSDSLYLQIKEQPLADTKIQKVYGQPVGGPLPATLFHASLSAGAWVPYDRLSLLGVHPSIGGNLGFRKNKAMGNLGLNFRLGKSGKEYQVMLRDSLYDTDTFVGIGISLDAGRELIQWRKHEFALLGGAGLEMIHVLTLENDPEDPDDDELKYLFSPSIHGGACYRYYFRQDRYLGISGRYHLLNFKNKDATNLRGNAITLTLEYGFGNNAWLHNQDTYLKERIPSGSKIKYTLITP